MVIFTVLLRRGSTQIDVQNERVVSTSPKVFQINVEIDNDDSRLFNVVNCNFDIQNLVSALI